MKRPSAENVWLTVFATVGLSVVVWNKTHPEPEPERYIDYCGDSRIKQLDAMQQDGITPLMLPDEDIHKYEHEASWVRRATVDELQIQLRHFDVKSLPSGHQLWIVTAAAPPLVHTLARQYECLVEELMDAEAAAHEPE
jgi:hypothetical protein